MLVFAVACTSEPTGSVQFIASVPQALSANDVTRVKVTVSAADMSSLVVEMAPSHGSWGGLIGNIPAGSNRSFLAEAFDSSGIRRFQGQSSGVTITANQTTAVAITLQELAPPLPYANEAPVIDSLVASSTSVQAGSALSLTATVHDPNAGDTLTLAWTASGGTFTAPTATSTSWTAPSSAGVQTLTLTVTDSQGAAVAVSLAVNVLSGASTGNAAVNISFNLWPTVSSVSASLHRLDAGQSTTVSAHASDADGDALSYQWAASCPGTWTNAASSSASFEPSSVPAGVCNNCRLTVTVQDGRGGQTTGSLHLCIASSSTQRFAPSFTHYYQSATAASPGQTVTFDVTALDPQSSTLTFAWASNTGSLASAQHTANTSHVVWTAPACVQTGVTPTVTATVTNAYGLPASKAFSLSGLPTCAADWTASGSMSVARRFHTATRLVSGKVFVTGGDDSSGYHTAADVFDPVTRSWSAAAPMAVGRNAHAAALLASGKVLVTGGNNAGALSTAAVYDPDTNSWSAATSMTTARFHHTSTLLPSGKVLIAGGLNSAGGLATAALYDPATNSWSAAGSMASVRYQHIATLLPSGKVLVTGGPGSPLAAAEVYNPATNTWASAGSMATARQLHTATLLSSGKVLVAGGDQPGPLASAEVYDPATNSWSAAAPMAVGRRAHAAALLPSGKVLIAGGLGTNSPMAASEVYDPATNSWSSTDSMTSLRNYHTATALSSGEVLVTGGYTALHSAVTSSTELYRP
ncbi:High-affinity leucine-specific transport system, periplasmic binding protein LivK [Hyalangium minutum]|uniref:High-affinity leucine-specific transport system, periplasmic binding protein LivK n=1 Tax=Hyalangium minutum TaxID=394096 RepID=A0A085WIC2_9BACT|nr:High-affinity leucine-specific transport system, periplasmic binding protein LivK [Hyalangium minutum]KFE67435.1 High-affinity leucine-specific transport system, periplasmic binding protein LivK [Hyalangium minutum]